MVYPRPTHDSLRAKFYRFSRPGMGYCFRCGFPWGIVRGHSTQYGTRGRGLFPLCEGCWSLLLHPEARIEYYKMLVDWWRECDSEVTLETEREIARSVANDG